MKLIFGVFDFTNFTKVPSQWKYLYKFFFIESFVKNAIFVKFIRVQYNISNNIFIPNNRIRINRFSIASSTYLNGFGALPNDNGFCLKI